MSTATPGPGIYHDILMEDYLQWEAVNQSSLGLLLTRSPAHYRQTLCAARPPTPAQSLGILAHVAGLEPLDIARRYVVMPTFENDVSREDGTAYSNPKASKAYRDKVAAFRVANEGKQIVMQTEYDRVVGLATAMRQHPRAAGYLRAEHVEVSMVWDDPQTGLRCKGRVDLVDHYQRRLCDLKTTSNAADFAYQMWKYRYGLQAAFYRDGYAVLTDTLCEFCIIAVETEPPFGVRAAPVSPDELEAGRAEYLEALRTIAACQKSGTWPRYSDPDYWERPPSKMPPLALTINGVPLIL